MKRGGCRLWFIGIAVVLLFGVVLVLVSPDGRYLLRAAYEQARILRVRRPIESVIADPSTSPWVARMLEVVLEARQFAADSLGLEVGDTYSAYADVGRDTLLLVLSASERHRLHAYTWRYPIVGVVPYKGFFNLKAARRAAARLEQRGLDVYLRTSPAYSTLGWFEDPFLSTALERDSVEVVATVIHEVSHNTVYLSGATAFNESFANFVGYRGAEQFFRSRDQTELLERAADAWALQLRSYQFFEQLAVRLDSLYGTGADSVTLDAGRQEVFEWAREVVGRPDWVVNNALVIAARLYRTKLEVFDRVLDGVEGRLAPAIAFIRERATSAPDPFAALSSP